MERDHKAGWRETLQGPASCKSPGPERVAPTHVTLTKQNGWSHLTHIPPSPSSDAHARKPCICGPPNSAAQMWCQSTFPSRGWARTQHLSGRRLQRRRHPSSSPPAIHKLRELHCPRASPSLVPRRQVPQPPYPSLSLSLPSVPACAKGARRRSTDVA